MNSMVIKTSKTINKKITKFSKTNFSDKKTPVKYKNVPTGAGALFVKQNLVITNFTVISLRNIGLVM